MKSERRHELQHNQLADVIGSTTAQVKPYARLIGGVIVLLTVLGIAYAYVTGKEAQQAAVGWDQYYEAVSEGNREQLAEIAGRFSDTSVAPWARIVAADMALAEGCGTILKDKANARDLLRQAVNSYQTVINDPKDEMLKQRALFGLGRAHESLATLEDLNKARADYKQLIDGWPNGVYKAAAEARLADLDKNSTKQFYDWFAKHDATPAVSPSGKKPSFLEENLQGDIKLPSALDDLDLGSPAGTSSPTPQSDKSLLNDLELPDLSTPAEKTEDASPAPAEEEKLPTEEPSQKPEK